MDKKLKLSMATRATLVKSSEEITLKENRIKHKAIDLRNNCKIVDLGNGYTILEPLDKNKIFS